MKKIFNLNKQLSIPKDTYYCNSIQEEIAA